MTQKTHNQKNIILETTLVYSLVIGILALAHRKFLDVPLISENIHTLSLTLFLYIPLGLCLLNRITPLQLGITYQNLRSSLIWFGVMCLVLYPPFCLGHFLYHTKILGHTFPSPFSLLPSPFSIKIWWLFLFQFLGVSLPEEVFYRGYIQSRLNQALSQRWVIGGTGIGPGLFITAFVFALGHYLVIPVWWRLDVFFPGLVFGWLRERTNGLLAPILFHTTSNVLMEVLEGVFL